jgi:hypothetical protein
VTLKAERKRQGLVEFLPSRPAEGGHLRWPDGGARVRAEQEVDDAPSAGALHFDERCDLAHTSHNRHGCSQNQHGCTAVTGARGPCEDRVDASEIIHRRIARYCSSLAIDRGRDGRRQSFRDADRASSRIPGDRTAASGIASGTLQSGWWSKLTDAHSIVPIDAQRLPTGTIPSRAARP